MSKIFVVNGPSESGKTTFGRYVGEILKSRGVDFVHTSSIKLVKQVLLPEEMWEQNIRGDWFARYTLMTLKRQITDRDWDGVTKDEYWRKVMSDLKLAITAENKYLIPHSILAEIDQLREPSVAFVDIREPENIQAFIDVCKTREKPILVETVFVDSDGAKEFGNYSDQSIRGMTYDYVVHNDRREWEGTWEVDIALNRLRGKAHEFIERARLIDTRRRPEII